MATKKILVPSDFTHVADVALEHAKAVAQATQSEIHVLHIVENKKNIGEAKAKLAALKSRVKESLGIDIHTIARIGNLYEDIDYVGLEIDASLIIMGTHGRKGMQFVTGSRALRIVTNSSIPFIITQEKGVGPNAYDDIVVPLDLEKETKQKLNIAADMAKYFNSRVHLVSAGESDEFLDNQLKRNLNYAEEFFSEKGLECTTKVTSSKSSSSAFVSDVIKHASASSGDLIAIMNIHGNSLFDIFGTNYAQKMIENDAQIPILILNPVETTIMDRAVFLT